MKLWTRLEAHVSTLEGQGAEKDKAIQTEQRNVDKERAKNAKTAAENAALVVRIEERDGQLTELKTTLKEANNNNKSLQAELVEIAKNTVTQPPR